MIGPLLLAVLIGAITVAALVFGLVSRDARRVRAVGWIAICLALASAMSGLAVAGFLVGRAFGRVGRAAPEERANLLSVVANEAMLYTVCGLFAGGLLTVIGAIFLIRSNRLRQVAKG